MNPMDLWSLWMKGWLKAADALVDMQRQYLQHGAGLAGMAQRGSHRTEEQVKEMTQTLARMQQDLAMAGARPATGAVSAAAEAEPDRPARRKRGPKPGSRRNAGRRSASTPTAAGPRRGRPRKKG